MTTIATQIFGHKHLHKRRPTTKWPTTKTEGMSKYALAQNQFVTKDYEDVATADPSESIDMKIQEKALEVADMIGDKTGIPAWVEVAIFVLIAVAIFCICGFCIKIFK